MKNIIVTGSLAFDYIMDFPGSYEDHILPEKIKTLSISFLVDNYSRNFGGVAGNIACNLGLLKQLVTIVASAGKNDFQEYEKHLQKVSVDTSAINLVSDDFTATASIITDKNNCQITGFYPGAMRQDSKLSLKSLPTEHAFLVIGPTVPEAMHNGIKEAKELNMPYLFDPAQQIPALQDETLEAGVDGADIVIGNDYEIALILEKIGFTKEQLLEKTKILVTTLGSEGSAIETRKEEIEVGIARPNGIVDPTGAGDAYIAGFIAGYTRQLPLQICGQLGACVATFAIERYGTQNHTFTMKQFNDRYREAFGESLDL